MASHEQEDTMPEETQGYKLSQPKQSLAEYQKMAHEPHAALHLPRSWPMVSLSATSQSWQTSWEKTA
ncbi:RHO protein GDP dissociation inhibitor [Colletotrichum higginsianum]|nr:RHO protein GDP dissociation inhibitor [Colletotrichum higginsianum]